MRLRNKKIVIGLFLVGILLTLTGVSYAYFTYRYVGHENRLSFGEVRLDIQDQYGDSTAVLQNGFPVTDEVGMGGEGYRFTLQNTGTVDSAYEIYLDNLTLGVGIARIADKYMRVQVVTDGYSVVDTLSNFKKRLLTYGYLKVGEKKNFTVRLWISDTAASSILHAQFKAQVRVQASQIIEGEVDKTGANAPELATGLIPAYYDTNAGTWRVADPYNTSRGSWYNYQEQMWANALTPTKSMYEYYANAPIGTAISMDDIDFMWVWIPRYEYKYTNLGNDHALGYEATPGGITINFLNGTKGSSNLSYFQVPNAFTFDGKAITGFWAAKFQAAYRANYQTAPDAATAKHAGIEPQNMLVKPLAYIWGSNNIYNVFSNCKQLTTPGANTVYDSTEVDTHLFRNSEWGAVAYLSQSKYGKYGNPMYTGSNRNVYWNAHSKTGYSTGSLVASSDGYVYPYNNVTDRGKGLGAIGAGASTTGNVSGVYDMNGGYFEYVAANFVDDTGAFRLGSSGFTAGSSYLTSKYFDLYNHTDTALACSGKVCYGDALSETAGWVTGTSSAFDAARPWMTRGGANSGTLHGIFYYDFANGAGFGNMSYRPSLIVIGGEK